MKHNSQRILLAAMCKKLATWHDWDGVRGEVAVDGIRHVSRLDRYGCPVISQHCERMLIQALSDSATLNPPQKP